MKPAPGAAALSDAFRSFAAATKPAAPRNTPIGKVYARSIGQAALGSFFYIPVRRDLSRPPLMCVHGISRNALEHVYAFRDLADEFGFPVVAPVFGRTTYRGYQTLGQKSGWNALAAFDGAVDDLAADLDTTHFNLFGFSGGGQFAHRYALARPERVNALSIAAAGWYTFPDEAARYPRGLAGKRPPGADIAAFLKLPMLVAVGSADRERDAALRQGKRINAQQGADRVERARNWVGAINAAAGNLGAPPPAIYAELSGAAHSFSDCIAAGLARCVATFFFHRQPRENRAPQGTSK